jgi:hypothetical protein
MDGPSLPLLFVLRPRRGKPEGLHGSVDERTAGSPKMTMGGPEGPPIAVGSYALGACYHMFPLVSAVLQPPSFGAEQVRLIGGDTALSRVIVNVLLLFFEWATIV